MSTSTEQKSEIKNGMHAVVIGASIAGLLAARVLVNHFERVTIVERDRLPEKPQPRPGVPQSIHVHALLVRGEQILEQLFPNIGAELSAAGAPTVDWIGDWSILGPSGCAPRFDSGLIGHATSRNLLEWLVRRRLAAYDNLQFLDESQITDLLIDNRKSKITGVQLRCRKETDRVTQSHSMELSTDLVVDASGRNSSMPKWLAALGYQPPQKTVINPFLGYATQWYQRPEDFQADWQGVSVIAHPSDSTRHGIIYVVEDNRWVVTLGGIGRDYPPNDEAGFLEFARSLRSPRIYEAIKDAKPLSPIYSYQRIENRLYHYDKLSRLPEGLVVLGDAVCAFNPIYAQGMTLAGRGALALDKCLHQQFRGRSRNLTGFGKRFQKQLARVNKNSWLMVTGEDLRWSTTEGGEINGMARLMHRYIDVLMMLAFQNPKIFHTLLAVDHMVIPLWALFQPSIVVQVIWQAIRATSNNIIGLTRQYRASQLPTRQ